MMVIPLILMTAIAFSFRYAPFVLSKWLKKLTLLEKLSAMLPVCILILLVAHNLEHSACGVAEIVGLLAVIGAQIFFRNILLSMAIGVFLHQLLMRI